MYVNKKAHYLSNSLFWAAGIHCLANAALFVVRRVAQNDIASQPDMVNTTILAGQIAIAAIQVILMAFAFIGAFDKLKSALSVVEESDRLKMAVLQQEAMGNKIPALTGDSIGKLLELWGAILIAVRMVYDICSLVYRRFITDLIDYSGSVSSSGEEFVYPEGSKNWIMELGAVINSRFVEILNMAREGLRITEMSSGPWQYEDIFKGITDFILSLDEQSFDFRVYALKSFLNDWQQLPRI